MPETVALPDGNSAVIRRSGEVPERLRREHLKAQSQMMEASGIKIGEDEKVDTSGFDVSAMNYMGPVNDTLIISYVKSWSYTSPDGTQLPVTVDAILDLPGEVYDFLLDQANKNSKGGVLDTSPSGAADPNSPTAPLAE